MLKSRLGHMHGAPIIGRDVARESIRSLSTTLFSASRFDQQSSVCVCKTSSVLVPSSRSVNWSQQVRPPALFPALASRLTLSSPAPLGNPEEPEVVAVAAFPESNAFGRMCSPLIFAVANGLMRRQMS